nr:terminase gpA endonuclease subunit [Afifella aestuarii]
MTPRPRTTPDAWAADNRVYAAHTGRPGPRDASITPYVLMPNRAIAEGRYTRIVEVMGAQMGKTDGKLDVIGERLDNAPVPIIYLGPSKEFNETQFEPRLQALLDESKTLAAKLARGKKLRKTKKIVGGVPIRLAHGGSSTALKSDPAALGIADEVDELLGNVKGQGNPIRLLEARGFTYAEFVLSASSTPSIGAVDVETDEESGLQFWKPAPPEDLESAIWRMWQEGTRHHWAWPCPHCGEFFIPRFRYLKWPKGATPAEARRTAYLECPVNGCVIEDREKESMNARGDFVAPGQHFDERGIVVGDPPDTSTLSAWTSGLASPFVIWGKRAEDFLTATLTGDPDEVQTAVNAGFGELFAPGGGDVPEWKEVSALRAAYRQLEVPQGVAYVVVTIDVQQNRLVYVVRGWGAKAESWLIDHGELWGEIGDDGELAGTTMALPVWAEAGALLQTTFGGLPVRRAFVDSGFRPGKPWQIPVNRVYEFCAQFRRICYPTKGSSHSQIKPLIVSQPEVTKGGKVSKYGLALIRLDPDHWKSWVHERVRWPQDQPGAWHLHAETTDDYCRQIVSEARLKKPSGQASWVRRSAENHYLDCEAMNAAAGYMLGVHRLTEAAVASMRAPAPAEPQRSEGSDDYFGDRLKDYW